MKKKVGASRRTQKAQKRGLSAASAFLPPKLTAPHPASIFPRKRLFYLLDRIRKKHPVIWISAPAGSGKTSLAASYLQERRLPVLWYQVDSGDGDIASFFYYMGIAAKKAAPRYKKPLPVLTPEYLGDIPTFTRNFFRELYNRVSKSQSIKVSKRSDTLTDGHSDTNRGFAIVLDNYQEAPENSALHDIIQIAMAEVPEGINLLVLSRNEPPSVLARLRLCEHAACLDWEKMRLTAEETIGISSVRMGKESPDSKALTTLHESVQGWAAGVVLMLEQSRGSAPLAAKPTSTDQKLIFDYFAGEIFYRCEPNVKEFLLKTALFPKFTAKAAEALTCIAESQAILDDLTRRNYFTVRHGSPSGDTYQYHPLFREFLLELGRTRFTNSERRALTEQAAMLLAAAGHADEAAELLREGGGEAPLIALILQHAPALAAQGRLATLEGWLRSLSQTSIEAQPWLSYWLGICRMPFNQRKARSHLEHAYSGFKHAPKPLGMYLAWTGIVETFSYEWDDYTPLDKWVEEIKLLRRSHPLDRYPQAEPRVVYAALHMLTFARSDDPELQYWVRHAEKLRNELRGTLFYMLVATALHLYYLWIGDLDKLREWSQDLSNCVTASETDPLARLVGYLALCMGGWICGDLALSRHWATMAMEYGTQQGIPFLNPLFYGQLNYICQFDNDLEGAALCVEQLQRAALPGRRLYISHYYYHATWLAVERGEFAQARAYIEKALALNEALGVRYPIALTRIKLSEVMAEFAEFDTALQHLNSASDFAGRMGSPALLFMIDMMRAWIMLRAGRHNECTEALTRALARARKEGRTTYANWHGRHVAALCAFALEHGIETDYVRHLIKTRKLLPPDGVAAPDLWPFPVKLYTLGRFSLLVDDKPIKFSGKGQKKPIELLKDLIAFGGRDVLEGQITDILWPEADGDAGHSAFTTTMQRLRKLLGNEDAILIKEGKITINPQYCYVDTWAFERLISKADEMWKENKESEALGIAEKALMLYKGQFLGKEGEEQGMLSIQERLRSKFIRTLAKIGGYLEKRGEWKKAVESYQKGIEKDNLCEEFYQSLMLCYQHLGLKAEAITAYNRCCNAMTALLNTEPSAKTKEIYQRIVN